MRNAQELQHFGCMLVAPGHAILAVLAALDVIHFFVRRHRLDRRQVPLLGLNDVPAFQGLLPSHVDRMKEGAPEAEVASVPRRDYLVTSERAGKLSGA